MGLPGSAAAGRGQGRPSAACRPLSKRARQAEVVSRGMDSLTAAIVAMGTRLARIFAMPRETM